MITREGKVKWRRRRWFRKLFTLIPHEFVNQNRFQLETLSRLARQPSNGEGKALDEMKSYCAIEHSEFNDLIRLFSQKTFSTDEQLIKHRRERKVATTSSSAEKFQSLSKWKRFFFRFERKKFFNHVRFDCDMCATMNSIFYRANWQCERLQKFGSEKCKRHAKVRTFEALCAMIDVARDSIASGTDFAAPAAHQSNLNFFYFVDIASQKNLFATQSILHQRIRPRVASTMKLDKLWWWLGAFHGT